MTRGKGKERDRRGARGFTSIELIVVILVLSVLTASIIIKNPFTISDYSSIAAHQLIADIQYVQMRAMGIGSAQSITFYPGTINAMEYTISGETGTKKLPADKTGNVVVTGTNFAGYGNRLFFNSLGEPCLSVSSPPTTCAPCPGGTTGCTVNVGSSSTSYRTIKIYAETAKVE